MQQAKTKGDRYRPVVTIQKIKKGIPTVLRVSGRTYALVHEDTKKG